MNDYLLPTDEDFVDSIAKAIAKNRILGDASAIVENMMGTKTEITEALESLFDPIFENLWTGETEHDAIQRKMYREDAKAAIAAINLKLLTMTT